MYGLIGCERLLTRKTSYHQGRQFFIQGKVWGEALVIMRDAAARALYLLCYDDEIEIDAYLGRFISRYGSLSHESAIAALVHTDSFDRAFSIFLLGMSEHPLWRSHVLSFLASDDPWEQWPSALCLGAVKDPAAFPVMCALLTAHLPSHPNYWEAGSGYLLVWRPYIARLLGEWGRLEAVAPLRQALDTVLGLSEESWYSLDLGDFTDEVVFALGRLQALGALTGLRAPIARIDRWRIHLSVGSMFGRYAMLPQGTLQMSDQPSEALQALLTMLETRWGITREQARAALRQYPGWKVEWRYKAEFIDQRSSLDLSEPTIAASTTETE